MSFLLGSHTPSYPDEQLSAHLSALSTLPVQLNNQLASPSRTSSSRPSPSPALERALQELSSARPLPREKLEHVLSTLAKTNNNNNHTKQGDGANAYVVASETDRVLEAEVLGRAVTIVWKEVLQELLAAALELEEERAWWDSMLMSSRGIGLYLIQTLPLRIYRNLPPTSSFSLTSLRSTMDPTVLFRTPPTPSTALTTLTSPYLLTRREVLTSLKALTSARDALTARIGTLALQAPNWAASDADLSAETQRVFSLLCEVLEVPPASSPSPTSSSSSSKRNRSSTLTPSQSSKALTSPSPTPSTFLALLNTHLPRARNGSARTLAQHRRPSALTRLWFPLLFLPPALYSATSAIVRNKEWMKEQLKNAKATASGFLVQWVWEPLEDIGETMRGGGEGLGVAPTTVKSDQASLERMVLDLGRDYYHLSGPALEALGDKVRAGDMEEVLRVYEREMQSPVKNALMGSLIRTLLIQVQKTKTDLSLSLLSLDHLLRSQQLTFAFVGVAPSVLILYGLGGWLRGVWKGERRGKGRKRAYFNGIRDIEKILITSPKRTPDLTPSDRGMLILRVSGMRAWAAGLGGQSREGFLEDLRMVEDPGLGRGEKLRVVERIWRCWGTDGRMRN